MYAQPLRDAPDDRDRRVPLSAVDAAEIAGRSEVVSISALGSPAFIYRISSPGMSKINRRSVCRHDSASTVQAAPDFNLAVKGDRCSRNTMKRRAHFVQQIVGRNVGVLL